MEENKETESNNGWLWAGLVIAGLIALDQKNKKDVVVKSLNVEKERVRYIESQYLILLQSYIERVRELPQGIREQLNDLISHYKGIDYDIASELQSVLIMVGNEQFSEAIMKLTKIVENILKDKYVQHNIIQPKGKFPTLFNMIEEAFKKYNWISKREYYFIELIREPRNQEAHTLNVNLSRNESFIYIMAGIELLHTFKGVKK